MKLFISDVDNTLVPQKERLDHNSLKILANKIKNSNIKLVYASGRSKKLVMNALKRYKLPIPDFILSDVGTNIYKRVNKRWVKDKEYYNFISKSWRGLYQSQIQGILKEIKEIKEQEPETQSKFKQSYYLNKKYNYKKILSHINSLLKKNKLESKIVYSVDQIKNMGLIDVLPNKAGKGGALLYLSKKLKLKLNDVLYIGDSGNDLDALTIGCKAVLVGNAENNIKKELQKKAKRKKILKRIYLAKHKYTLGVIEGAKHFGFF